MDRITLNIAPALRLLLVGGMFAVFWIIFGAGSAHAAAPPPGENPHTADGLVTSLTAPVKPLITAVQPRTEPAPPSTTAPSPVQGPASAARPVGGTAAPAAAPVRPATAPVTQLVAGTVQPLLAPVTDLSGAAVAPLTAPATQLVTGTIQPLLTPVTDLAGAAVTPLTAPATQLVSGTVQPILAPVTGLAGSVLNPIASPVEAVTGPVTGLITGTAPVPVSIGPVSVTLNGPPAAAASPVAPGTVNTSAGGGEHATPTVETQPAAVFTAKPGASTTVLPLLPTGLADRIAARRAASMDEGGASRQSPARLPGGHVPATAPAPSPVSGSAGAPGPTGAGAQAAADLSYRFVLPMTQGGDGSLFSFVLPGSTTQDPGFSPD
ncbi:hypothetical protein [Pseudarthrobacter sp. NPDC080039]|uniref:hypothetical protein n=1 Tax=unclassified Pseudarthrobacter TaxID=2647000 RepID=UPI003450B89C